MTPTNDKKRLYLIIGVVIFLIILVVIALTQVVNREPENAPEFTEQFGPATIINGEELAQDIGLERFTYFRDDVTFLARSSFDEYRDQNNQIVFTVQQQNGDETIVVDGVYEELATTSIRFEVTPLGNGVIKNEYFIDGEKGDVRLPSTTQDNLFVASLPYQGDGFKVSYLDDSESFYVTFSRPVDEELLEEARKFLREGLEEELTFYQFSSLGEDENGRIRSFEIAPEFYVD